MDHGGRAFYWRRCAALIFLPVLAQAATWHVAPGGSDAAAGTNWTTAKQTIQAAVDLTADGDLVLVSNGVYATGGRALFGSLTNRVAITNAITVRSVQGADATFIVGAAAAGSSNGDAAVRCVYLASNAVLAGFTLTNGHTRADGDAVLEQSGGGVWCMTNSVLSNCVLAGNSAQRQGCGAYRGRLYNCVLAGNVTDSPLAQGGGAALATLFNCLVADNRANLGGGSYLGALYNCTVVNNTAASAGGGSANDVAYNSIIYFNVAPTGQNFQGSACHYSCTYPTPSLGFLAITNNPLLASASHLSTNSPCRGLGSTNYTVGVDLDGEAWANPPARGCDEVVAGALTGALAVAAQAAPATVPAGVPVRFAAVIAGRPAASTWDFADGAAVTNQPFAEHAFAATGSYAVVLRAYHLDAPAGVAATVTVQVVSADYYVAPGGGHVAPFDSWATAATTIQAAIDVVLPGSTIWVSNGLYASGGRVVFGAMTNRVAITNAIAVRAVNGPAVTAIIGAADPATTNGDAAVRCVYLGPGAALSGFTLSNGHTRIAGDVFQECSGGGVWCATNPAVSNCVITGNGALYYGGGAYLGRLHNCTLTDNRVNARGGGAYNATLSNCTVGVNIAPFAEGGGAYGVAAYGSAFYGNVAARGGGAFSMALFNCTVVGNRATLEAGGAHSCFVSNSILYHNTALSNVNHAACTLRYTCATPPGVGPGNFTNEPVLASATHLATNSPCLGAGGPAPAPGVDLDGEPWAFPAAVGCDEFVGGAVTGPLSVAAYCSATNALSGSNLLFVAATAGRTTHSVWDFGDGTQVTNQGVAFHAFVAGGVYAAVVRAFNDSTPLGVAATVTVAITGAEVFVAPGGGHIAPFTSWATAATNIQDALDVAPPGATVWVSNGVYSTGGRAVGSALTNRVSITNVVALRSVNGPAVTVIQGAPDPVTTNGDAAVRCVYAATNAVVAGFTFANGHTRTAGTFLDQSGGGFAAALANYVTVSNCVLASNRAAFFGGGAYQGLLYHCTLTGNRAAVHGGGAGHCTLRNCVVAGNTAASFGGGAYQGTLWNCAVYGNAGSQGGGANLATLNNCTVAGNTATTGGGLSGGNANNCIVYFNTAVISNNHYDTDFAYSCTTPLPGAGSGNISNDPQLASLTRLATNSPCRGAGSTSYLFGATVDLDGEAWNAPPSMGSDEVHAGALTGALTVAAAASPTSLLAGATVNFAGAIEGRVTHSTWSFGDGVVVSNQPLSAHAFATAGTYQVVLRAYNETFPGGIVVTVAVQVLANDYFVAPGGGHIAPYDTWAKAGTNLQTVIDSVLPGAVVWVSNGVYNTGGQLAAGGLTNRVVINKPVTVRSANGPAVTVIAGRADPAATNGDAAVRCVYLGSNATLIGFTLTNGHTRTAGDAYYDRSGGGVLCTSGRVVDCVLAGNGAENGGGAVGGLLERCTLTGNRAEFGGGAYASTLDRCVVRGNRASSGGGVSGGTLSNCLVQANVATSFLGEGGGAINAVLSSCTVVGNISSNTGGGVSYCSLLNSIVYFNTAVGGAPNCDGTNFIQVCTTPDPGGVGIITNDPLFVSAAATNYRLTARSPCVNRGSNDLSTAAADLDGHARIQDGTLDLGAYELPGPPFTGTWFVAVSGSDGAPGTSWTTAKQTLQAAADLALGGERILASNGVYAAGGRAVFGALTNRVALTNAVRLESVNGPAFTAISGTAHPTTTNGDAVLRCVYLGTNATLAGFTLTNGHTRAAGDLTREQSGGGVFCAPGAQVSNCVLAGNSAAFQGGGAYGGTLVNCVLTRNAAGQGGGACGALLAGCQVSSNVAVRGGGLLGGTASNSLFTANTAGLGGAAFTGRLVNAALLYNAAATNGGGAHGGLLVNCTVASNSAAGQGGGCFSGTVHNGIVYFNTAPTGANFQGTAFTNSCTTPAPGGTANFTNDPVWANVAGGDFRLGGTSPCRDAGSNQLAQGTTDLDGAARVFNGRVDLGAYELALLGYWNWASVITNGLTGYADSATGDGYANLLRYAAGSSPTNPDGLARLTVSSTNQLFALRFRRDTNAVDITILVEGSYELSGSAVWTALATNSGGSWGGATNVFEAPGTNPVEVTITDLAPGTNRFLRQRVTRP